MGIRTGSLNDDDGRPDAEAAGNRKRRSEFICLILLVF
jgi:hypothetical protein